MAAIAQLLNLSFPFPRSSWVLEVWTFLVIVGLSILRIKRGSFPTWIKYCAPLYLWSLLLLWQRRHGSTANRPFGPCTFTKATAHDGKIYLGYSYEVSVTDRYCDAIDISAAIGEEIVKCANQLLQEHAVAGCCKFSGESSAWFGRVKLSANLDRYSFDEVAC